MHIEFVRSDVENLIMKLDRLQSEYLLCDKNARNDYYLAKRERFNSSGKSSLEILHYSYF